MSAQFMLDTFLQLLAGIPLTLQLTAIAFCIGSVLATILASMRMSGFGLADWFARSYVFIFRGTPLLVQLFLIYYGFGQFRPTFQALGLWQFFREPYWCAILALSLNTAAYGSEILRGALHSVPEREVEAARACGMSGLLLYRRIIFPVALRQALPAYGNELILLVKATSLTSIITMMEVTGIAARLISSSYRPLEVFVTAGAIYLFMNFILTRAISLLDWWLTPHLRRPTVSIKKMGRING